MYILNINKGEKMRLVLKYSQMIYIWINNNIIFVWYVCNNISNNYLLKLYIFFKSTNNKKYLNDILYIFRIINNFTNSTIY